MALSDIASTKITWTKAEIQALLIGCSEPFIRNTINEIVSTEMNISLNEAKKLRPSNH